MTFLLDTNMISEIRKGARAHPQVARWVEATPADRLFTSVIVLAEIRRGIELKRRHDRAQAALLDDWYEAMRAGLGERVLPVSEPVAETWARLGIPDPLPLFDGLLAATALVHGMTLVTRNVVDVARSGVPTLDPFAQ